MLTGVGESHECQWGTAPWGHCNRKVAVMDERTRRQQRARKSRIIGDVYAAWVAERIANGTYAETQAGEVGTEEHAELASLTSEVECEVHRRTTGAFRSAGLCGCTSQTGASQMAR